MGKKKLLGKIARSRGGRGRARFRGSRKWIHNIKMDPPNWSQMNLEVVKKDFYQEHPNVKARDGAAVKEYMDQNRISVQGRDCPKPVEAFDEFCFPDFIMNAVKAHNFEKPTPIQSQAIPVALSGRDMVGIAETGSGKTLAFILPAIAHILGNDRPKNIGEPEVVVLAPTRELAQQIHQVVVSLGPGIRVKSECFYGGTKRAEQMVLTQKVFEICIATPGRMVDFLCEKMVKLHRCTYFVLDEADRMLDLGFEPQIREVLVQSRPDRQMLMFSATWPPEIRNLAESFLKDYILVNIGSLEISANHNITQKLEFCEDNEKPQRIVKVMKQIMEQKENKTLIFVNVKVDVDVLTLKFRFCGWAAMGLHGGKKQAEREKVFNDFKTGKISILIATDIAARGLDVDDIKYIINYDYPMCSEDYVHRIGRTARCNRKGTAITFLTNQDRNAAKGLISVLEEAKQDVPLQLKNMARLPPLPKKKKNWTKKITDKMTKKQVKKLMMRSDVNSVPIGSEINANSLPDLTDIVDTSVLKKVDTVPGKKKKNKTKLKFVLNSENKIAVSQNQPIENQPPCKKVKAELPSESLHADQPNNFKDDRFSSTGLHSDDPRRIQSDKCTHDYYTDSFENPQWAPSENPQRYEEDTWNIPGKIYSNRANLPMTNSTDMQNSGLGMKHREMGHCSEVHKNTTVSADIRGGNDVFSTDNRGTHMSATSRDYKTGMVPRGDDVYSRDHRYADISASRRSYETTMGSRGDDVYSKDNRSADVSMNSRNYDATMGSRGNDVYSKDNRYAGMPTSSRNYETTRYLGDTGAYSTNDRNPGMSVSSGRYETAMTHRGNNVYSSNNRDRDMPVNSRNYETNIDHRNMGSSMNTGNRSVTMGPENYVRISVDRGNSGVHLNPQNMQHSRSARNASGSLDEREHTGGWYGSQDWGKPTNNNYMGRLASDQGPSRSNYGMNSYPSQNWSGRGRYSQY